LRAATPVRSTAMAGNSQRSIGTDSSIDRQLLKATD